MSNNWNLNKLEKQASNNQNFDEYVLNESKMLKYSDLSVLDVGCSNGFKTEMLFGKHNNITRICGIDIDSIAINQANESFKSNERYTFVLSDFNSLICNDKFDIIYLSYVLQHLDNPTDILNKVRNMLTDRGIIIIKVPDDSFKFCYPNDNVLKEIFDLYENNIIKKTDITRFTDRYIGKKVYSYLSDNSYKNIRLYYSITDTIGKSQKEKENIFNNSIAFRNVNSNDINSSIKKRMDELLKQMKKSFEQENFYYTMSVLYYIATKN